MQEHFEEHQNQINPTNSHWCSLGHQVRFTVHKTHSGMKCLPLENWTEFICLWNKDYSSSIFAIQKQTHICLYKRKICKKYRIVSTLTGIHVKIGIKATSKLKKKNKQYILFLCSLKCLQLCFVQRVLKSRQTSWGNINTCYHVSDFCRSTMMEEVPFLLPGVCRTNGKVVLH